MWVLNNHTPYAAERNWIRDKNGAHHWVVAVRATFDISVEGRATLAEQQPAPVLIPEYRGDPSKSSLLVDSDLLAAKPSTDIVLDAVAHAPHGRPAETVQVGFRLGDVEKNLVVHGARYYYAGPLGLATSEPRPFETQPIEYELAFGGMDTSDPEPRNHRIDGRNPVGRGFAVKPAHMEGTDAHQIEYTSGFPGSTGPAGFGPIACHWEPRSALAGTYDEQWERARRPLLPEDYDERFALCSPVDQRSAKGVRGGEPVALLNLTPEGLLRFDLPKMLLTFRTRIGSQSHDHRASLVTVLVVPHEKRVSMVWQTTLPVKSRDLEYLDMTTIGEKRYLR